MQQQRHRSFNKFWNTLFLVQIALSLLIVTYNLLSWDQFFGVMIVENTYLYALLGLFVSPVFLMFPINKNAAREKIPWYDIAIYLLTLGVCSYYAYQGLDITRQGWEFVAPPLPTALAIILWAIVLEGVRRVMGKFLLGVCLVFSMYPLYAGFMPEMVSGFNLSFLETARYHAMSIESIMGLPMRVGTQVFIGFIIMGVALTHTGAGKFFIDLSNGILGGFRGGPAKVSIIASAFFGSMSGSVISNILTTGPLTIAAMKKVGYKPRVAGAVEACASSGGVLMPPIMGAVAFLMASMLDVPYMTIVVAAVIPSFLYFLGLIIQVDAIAATSGMKGLPPEELPSTIQALKSGWYFIFVLAVLIWLLMYLRREAPAPFYTTAMLLVVASFNKDTRMNWTRIKELIDAIGRIFVEMFGMLAAIGLVLGALSVTGMAVTFSGDLVRIAGGSIPALLIMGAVTSFTLGMGMSVSACYLFLAIVLAPALTTQGLNPVAVHLFLVYWGCVSYITPPVAVGAFTAAAVAGSEPMRTGFESLRLGAVKYLLPFIFVLNPVLLFQGATFTSFMYAFATSLAAVLLISAGLQGYMIGIGGFKSGLQGFATRVLIVISGILIGWPGELTGIIGMVICIPLITFTFFINQRLKQTQTILS